MSVYCGLPLYAASQFAMERPISIVVTENGPFPNKTAKLGDTVAGSKDQL
jgi:hypothetical protein